MRFAPLPDIEYLRTRLRYEPDTGHIYWRDGIRGDFPADRHWKTWNTKYSGKRAGRVAHDGYVRIHLNRAFYGAHRIAWALHTGSEPTGVMDHINRDRTDNRIANLRDVTISENNRNRRFPPRNKSGCVGVWWNEKAKRWIATIGQGGEPKNLGQFVEFSDAVSARKSAEQRLGYHPNHGVHIPSQIEEGK